MNAGVKAGASDDPPRFSKGRVDLYGGRLLPICCPTPRLTFGTTSLLGSALCSGGPSGRSR